MFTSIQNAFGAGEISPSLFGRTDLAKYHQGASTFRNFFVNYRGGASSRPGFAYVGTCLQSGTSNPPRDIPFQFSINQGYALEFGDNPISITTNVTGTSAGTAGAVHLAVGSTANMINNTTYTISGVLGTLEANGVWVIQIIDMTHIRLVGSTYANAYSSGGTVTVLPGYMRIKSSGAYVTETPIAITGITQASPAVISTAGTLPNVGDWVYINNVVGMTNFNGLTWKVNSSGGGVFTVTDLFGNAVNSTLFNAYVSGGTFARIYTVPAPYNSADLQYLKFTQSADTMTLTCVNQLTNTEYPSYELERTSNAGNIAQYPGGVWTFTPDTFSSPIAAPGNVTAVAQASTTITTWYGYIVTAVDDATGSESVGSTPVTIQNNDIGIYAGANVVSWNPVVGASSYNIYKATPSYNAVTPVGSQYGFAGRSLGTSFTDNNITANFDTVPPVHNNPFARSEITSINPTAGGVGYTPANIGYTLNTTTGSGFSGTPIVTNNKFTGFLIQNGGFNFGAGDTITITGGGAAVGTINFQYWANLAQFDTVTLNGTVWTFVQPPVVAADQSLCMSTQTGLSLGLALAQFVSNLNQSTDTQVSKCSYSLSSTTTGYVINITNKTPGVGGNSYTLAISLANGGATINGSGTSGTLGGGAASGGATATLSIGPATGTYPGVPAYFQQRRTYANSLNNPDTYEMSQPGAFNNMDASTPVTDSDAITGSPWSQQINGIQFLVPMPGGLVVLTGKGAWQLNGGAAAAITPADQTATPQAYNGCSAVVPPIVVNYDILYVQSKNSIVRDLSYNFFVNIYTGTDMTVLSNQLFDNHLILQWAYAEEPFKLVWATREDGALLCLTYLKEQDVYGWSRHDTNGLFVSICSVTEPPVDAVYTIVKRYVRGQWVYYSERMDNRNWQRAENSFCVDSGIKSALNFPNAILTPAAANGTYNISSTNLISGGTGYTSPTITVHDPKNAGSGATFSVMVVSGVITAITVLTQGQNYTPGSQLVISDPTGNGAVAQPIVTNNVLFTASASVFNSGMVNSVIRGGNGKATITSYISGTQVMANITTPISLVLQNDPNHTPVPIASGNWNIGTPITIVAGLNHLEGMTVAILADGSVVPNQVVVGGQITLPHPFTYVVVGLPFTCQLQTLYLDVPSPAGSNQSKRKNLYRITARVEATRGISVGSNQPDASVQPNQATLPWTNMIEVKERNAMVNAGDAIPLFTGDIGTNIKADWNTKGQIAVQQSYPLPANILALIPDYLVGDSPGA